MMAVNDALNTTMPLQGISSWGRGAPAPRERNFEYCMSVHICRMIDKPDWDLRSYCFAFRNLRILCAS